MFSARDVWKKETQAAEGCLTNDDAKAGFHCIQHNEQRTLHHCTVLLMHGGPHKYDGIPTVQYTEGQYPERD